ncbi:hypothetical protein BJX76DRAFT_126420 [Aspergillus varians]
MSPVDRSLRNPFGHLRPEGVNVPLQDSSLEDLGVSRSHPEKASPALYSYFFFLFFIFILYILSQNTAVRSTNGHHTVAHHSPTHRMQIRLFSVLAQLQASLAGSSFPAMALLKVLGRSLESI